MSAIARFVDLSSFARAAADAVATGLSFALAEQFHAVLADWPSAEEIPVRHALRAHAQIVLGA